MQTECKFITLASLLHALRKAYSAACKAMGLARKIKNKELSKKHRSRATSLKNKIRGELCRFEKDQNLFGVVAYRGVIINVFR